MIFLIFFLTNLIKNFVTFIYKINAKNLWTRIINKTSIFRECMDYC